MLNLTYWFNKDRSMRGIS